jgi:tRNA(adenine34) deaminase
MELKKDFIFMGKAIEEARKALRRGEVPIGAVLVSGDQIIARGYNQPWATSDPTAHAEIVALRKAARKIGNYRLYGLTVFVTLEPCPMCLGAILQARLKRLVYGAEDPKAGAVVSQLKFAMNKANHHPEIVGGIRADECRQLLKDFFREKRKRAKKKKLK